MALLERANLNSNLENSYFLCLVAMYQEIVNVLIDGDKVSGEIMATQGLRQGYLLSPPKVSYSFTNQLGQVPEHVRPWGKDSLANN